MLLIKALSLHLKYILSKIAMLEYTISLEIMLNKYQKLNFLNYIYSSIYESKVLYNTKPGHFKIIAKM
jgi:hypothetical protein